MNISLTTSFIIGGLLLLTMLALNSMVMQESSKTTIEMSNRQIIDDLRQVITQDFNHIGFQPADQNNAKPSIASFNPPEKINFFADVYGQGGQIIKWQFLKNTDYKETANPNDRVLQRNGPLSTKPGSGMERFPVVDFSLTGYSDIQGDSVTTDKDAINSIRVRIVYESPEPIGKDGNGNDRYYRAVWRKLFVPSNIQLN